MAVKGTYFAKKIGAFNLTLVVVPFGKKTCSLAFRVSFVSFGDYDECYITKHTNLVSSRKSNYFGGQAM